MARINVVTMTPVEVVANRQRLGMSRKEFANFLGVTVQAVGYWEESQRTTPEAMTKVIRFFGQYPHLKEFYR